MGMLPLDVGGISGVLTIATTVVVLVGTAAGVIAYFTFTRQNDIQKRQAGWITELTARLDYVEPRLQETAKENRMLKDLLNPVDLIERNTEKITTILNDQYHNLTQALERIEQKVDHDGR
jgi:small-conductance mechanosensitive channel